MDEYMNIIIGIIGFTYEDKSKTLLRVYYGMGNRGFNI